MRHDGQLPARFGAAQGAPPWSGVATAVNACAPGRILGTYDAADIARDDDGACKVRIIVRQRRLRDSESTDAPFAARMLAAPTKPSQASDSVAPQTA